MIVSHLALAADWVNALECGTYDVSTRGSTIAEVGYLHGSANRRQTDAVARRLYADVTEALVLLEIDAALLATYGIIVRLEPADPALSADGGHELFPHIYGGPVPVAAVIHVSPYVVPSGG